MGKFPIAAFPILTDDNYIYKKDESGIREVSLKENLFLPIAPAA